MDLDIDSLLDAAGQMEKDGRLFQAEAIYEKILRKDPNAWLAQLRIGNLYHRLRKYEDAYAHYQTAAEIAPNRPEPWHNLANTLQDMGQRDKAEEYYRKTVKMAPAFAPAICELGSLLYRKGNSREALHFLHRTLALDPQNTDARTSLASIRARQGFVDEALELYRQAQALDPENFRLIGAYLFFLYFSSNVTPEAAFAEYRRWAETFAPNIPTGPTVWPNSPEPDRKLRIGFVSPDFREHPVSNYLLPFLIHHDPAEFEIFCYASVEREDNVTADWKMQRCQWVDCLNMGDKDLWQRVRTDQIDLLVDLSGHMAGHRLRTFADRAAPVQITQIGYPASTGLEQMDYRISDPFMDPPGMTESVHTEELLRVPHCAFCYQPMENAPEPGAPPCSRNGYLTFGSFNNFAKVSPPCAEAWEKIILATPDSRLLILIKGGESNRDTIAEKFPQIPPARILLHDLHPREDYLKLHQQVDLFLDPFPYSGGLTTFEALWMGVPGITLAGNHSSSRHGVSIYSCLDMKDWIATSPADYMERILEKAANRPHLAELRSTLREKMAASPLMDATGYARSLSQVYREAWQKWCSQNRDQ